MMGPFSPRDSESEAEDIYQVDEEDDDMEYIVDENAPILTLDENDRDPGMDDEENGYIPDDSTMMFGLHQGSVFCIDNSPTQPSIVITGGEDDKGYVWNVNDGEKVFECNEHKDSVISCGFSKDGKYVMTADMSGIIMIRNSSDGKKVFEYECSDLEWCKWHNLMNVIFAGTSDGEIYMLKIPRGDCKIYQGHGSKTTSGFTTKSGKEFLSGYEDGVLKLWDLKTSTSLFTHNHESGAILSLACHSNGKIIACGTSDGKVKILNATTGKVVHIFSVPFSKPDENPDEEMDDFNAVETLQFPPNSEQYIASAGLAGTLDVWDMNTERIRYTCKHPAGITRMSWTESDPPVIITACLDGIVRTWDSLSGQLLKEYHGHRENILDMCLSSDNKFILTASDDNTARVFSK